jgi:DNA polymerase III delta' subunit
MLIGHQKQWDFLKRKFEQNQLSHAYLFTGANQIGKKAFAKEFIKMISCKSTEVKPCQKCVNCQMIERGSYPDLFLINPEEGGEITISKAREAQSFLSYKSYYGSLKFVIVDEAEKMNTEAQSCFLKTLEEPKGQTLLVLVSSKPEMLLPTIYSRCQNIKFFRPKNLQPNSEKVAKEQVILSELLKVINSDFSEKFKYAKSIDFEKQKIGEILEVLQKYFRKLLFAKIGVLKSKEADSYPILKIKKIIKLIEDINFQTLFTNASPKLALEILLMEI